MLGSIFEFDRYGISEEFLYIEGDKIPNDKTQYHKQEYFAYLASIDYINKRKKEK